MLLTKTYEGAPFLALFARKPALSEVEWVELSMFIRHRHLTRARRAIPECGFRVLVKPGLWSSMTGLY
jgi:hypothetical protein